MVMLSYSKFRHSIAFKSRYQKPPGGVKRLANRSSVERENGTSKPVISVVEQKLAKAPAQLPVVKKKRKLPKAEECTDDMTAISPDNVDVESSPATKTASKPNSNAKFSDGDDRGGGLGGLLSYASSEDEDEG